MKENLLLLRDLLEPWKTRFLNTWQLFQKMFILMCSMILLINTIVHKTIRMKPMDITDDSYAEYNEDFNKKIKKKP